MTTTLTLAADDWTALGLVPAVGVQFSFTPVHIAEVGGRVQSGKTFGVVLDATGAASTSLPDAAAGNGVRIDSGVAGWSAVYVASYPTGTVTLTTLLTTYVVDPATLAPIAAPAAWYTALSAYVKTVNGTAPDGAGNVVVAGGGAVSSVVGRTGAVTLTSTDVGLGNVNNTSDANKPVSTAQAAADTAVQAAAATDATNKVATETTRATTAEGLAAQKASNLSDLASAATARTNLGLGTAALQASTVPARAGSHLGVYDPNRYLYNANAANTRGFRDLVGVAKAGGLARLSCVGDSKTMGHDAAASIVGGLTIENTANSYPSRLRNAMVSRGVPSAGTGWVFGNQGGITNPSVDSRWTRGTGWTSPAVGYNFAQCSTLNAVLTFTSDIAGTVVEIITLSNSGAFQYRIDGGSYTVYTPTGSSVQNTITVSGLANTTHTIDIQTTTATATYIMAVNVRQTSGLFISNHGNGSSTTSNWNTGGLFYSAQNTLSYVSATAVIISLGTNDARTGVTVSNYTLWLGNLIANQQALGRAVALLVPTPAAISDTTYATWTPFVQAMYNLADTYNIPLIDLTEQYGTWEISNPAGKQSDILHENASGYAVNAETVLGLLAPV